MINKIQKKNRYYISNKGGVIYKLHTDGREQFVEAHPLKGKAWKIQLVNKLEQLPIEQRDIHYEFYIRETNKIVKALLPDQLNLF